MHACFSPLPKWFTVQFSLYEKVLEQKLLSQIRVSRYLETEIICECDVFQHAISSLSCVGFILVVNLVYCSLLVTIG